jgi:hypothetical protein
VHAPFGVDNSHGVAERTLKALCAPPRRPPPHPGHWQAAPRAASARRRGLQPGDTRGRMVSIGATAGADCQGDATRLAQEMLHASRSERYLRCAHVANESTHDGEAEATQANVT